MQSNNDTPCPGESSPQNSPHPYSGDSRRVERR